MKVNGLPRAGGVRKMAGSEKSSAEEKRNSESAQCVQDCQDTAVRISSAESFVIFEAVEIPCVAACPAPVDQGQQMSSETGAGSSQKKSISWFRRRRRVLRKLAFKLQTDLRTFSLCVLCCLLSQCHLLPASQFHGSLSENLRGCGSKGLWQGVCHCNFEILITSSPHVCGISECFHISDGRALEIAHMGWRKRWHAAVIDLIMGIVWRTAV